MNEMIAGLFSKDILYPSLTEVTEQVCRPVLILHYPATRVTRFAFQSVHFAFQSVRFADAS